jgi:hypothetical protein
MWMAIEGGDVVEQSGVIQVGERGQRCDFRCAFDNGGTQPQALCTGTSSAFVSERVDCPKRCWGGNQGVTVVLVLDLTLGEIGKQVRSRPNHWMITATSSGSFLFGQHMVETEDHECVGIGEDPLVDRQPVAGLVDALENRNRVPVASSASSWKATVERWKNSSVPAMA